MLVTQTSQREHFWKVALAGSFLGCRVFFYTNARFDSLSRVAAPAVRRAFSLIKHIKIC
jgi:hypothetical protein